MNYQGDIGLGDTIDIKFTTVSSTGVPTTLAGTPVVSAYVDNNTTEITAGITLTADFDGRAGLHNVRVVASSGNGFATATNVNLVITTGTVGGNSVVGYVVGSFSIGKRPATVTAEAIKVKTDQLNFSGVYVKATLDGALVSLTSTANNDVADAVLKRDWTLVSGEALYSLLNAARLLRNVWNTTEVPNNLVVKKENGSTTAWSRPVATNAAADPIVGVST